MQTFSINFADKFKENLRAVLILSRKRFKRSLMMYTTNDDHADSLQAHHYLSAKWSPIPLT
jgi:hypothetical protein